MTTFFILLLLYGFLLPLLSYWIIQQRIKGIAKLRMVLNTRYATHRIHGAIGGCVTDVDLILDILRSRIDKSTLISSYHRYYGKNIIDELRYELDNESYRNALRFLKT